MYTYQKNIGKYIDIILQHYNFIVIFSKYFNAYIKYLKKSNTSIKNSLIKRFINQIIKYVP